MEKDIEEDNDESEGTRKLRIDEAGNSIDIPVTK
jgi:hypothetical protein